jgi:hypothetical protein
MDVQQWLLRRLSGPMTMFGSLPFMLLIFEGQSLLLGNSCDTCIAALPSLIVVLKRIEVKLTQINICPRDTELNFNLKNKKLKVRFHILVVVLSCLLGVAFAGYGGYFLPVRRKISGSSGSK